MRRSLKPSKGVEQEELADAGPLVVTVDSQSSQQNRRDRVARDTTKGLTSVFRRELIGDGGVVPGDPDLSLVCAQEGSDAVSAVLLASLISQPAVQRWFSAIEGAVPDEVPAEPSDDDHSVPSVETFG